MQALRYDFSSNKEWAKIVSAQLLKSKRGVLCYHCIISTYYRVILKNAIMRVGATNTHGWAQRTGKPTALKPVLT